MVALRVFKYSILALLGLALLSRQVFPAYFLAMQRALPIFIVAFLAAMLLERLLIVLRRRRGG